MRSRTLHRILKFQLLKAGLLLLFSFEAVSAFAQAGQLAVINTDSTHLRDCSGLNCPVIGLLKKGQHCRIILTEKLEEIGDYGINTWAEVVVNNRSGFVYSALLRLLPPPKGLIHIQQPAIATATLANIRTCPSRKCDILFQLYEGSFCQAISKTDHLTQLPGEAKAHPWYLIDYQGNTGFIHGSILSFAGASAPPSLYDKGKSGHTLAITATKATIHDDHRHAIGYVYKGQQLPVIRQEENSELIRPYGRHYWYLVNIGDGQYGWVFGAFTSKSNAPVNCQCVDFVKHTLDITGPTKNAFEWDEVLMGKIPITIGGKVGALQAREILAPERPEEGDIAVFDNTHLQAHPDYGHIGFVRQVISDANGQVVKVLIEGGNHDQMPLEAYYVSQRCDNVSEKWYRAEQSVRFFRLN